MMTTSSTVCVHRVLFMLLCVGSCTLFAEPKKGRTRKGKGQPKHRRPVKIWLGLSLTALSIPQSSFDAVNATDLPLALDLSGDAIECGIQRMSVQSHLARAKRVCPKMLRVRAQAMWKGGFPRRRSCRSFVMPTCCCVLQHHCFLARHARDYKFRALLWNFDTILVRAIAFLGAIVVL